MSGPATGDGDPRTTMFDHSASGRRKEQVMSIRHLKPVLIGAVLASLLAGAASAEAAGWNTNGPLNFTATTGVLKWTDARSGAVVNCAGTTSPNAITATLNASSGGSSGTGLGSGIRILCNDATVSTFRFTMSCTATALNGLSWLANGGTSPNYYGSITAGTITGISCTLSSALCTARITGMVNMNYVNPTATLAGRLTISNVGQSLSVVSGTCSVVNIATGDAMRLTDSASASPVFTVTIPAALASQPRIWV
jgi:hypothetical protein